jgi:hypothetical protein
MSLEWVVLNRTSAPGATGKTASAELVGDVLNGIGAVPEAGVQHHV